MDTFRRQQDLLTPEDLEGLHVDLVGAGALGGALLITLGKMGFGIRNRITVTDFDRCEEHNLPSQWFRPSDVLLGRSKVDALADMARWVADREVVAVAERFHGDEARAVGPIVVLAVDTLAERRAIWERLRGREDVRLVVDVRAGAEVVEIWTVECGAGAREAAAGRAAAGRAAADDATAYEAGLAGDPFEEPCTRRAVFYTALGAAAVVGSLVRAWVRRERTPRRVTWDLRNFWVDVEARGTAPSRSGLDLPATAV